jgi:histidinol-phosphate phosphatase family protein
MDKKDDTIPRADDTPQQAVTISLQPASDTAKPSYSALSLTDIISLEELEKILQTFVLATGFSSTYVSPEGEYWLTPRATDSACKFCSIIQSCPEGKKRCVDSMCYAGRLASQLGEPYIYQCHAGLVELSSPIQYGDTYLGSVSCGPVLMWDWDELVVREITERTRDLPLDHAALIAASRDIRVLSSRSVQAAAQLLFIVTNQSGVARGYYTERDLRGVERHLRGLMEGFGAELAGFFYCPHHPDGKLPGYAVRCTCRKPEPGLIFRAADEHGIDLRNSWLVGDILNDVEAGRMAGCRTVLINNGKETEWILSTKRLPHHIVANLAEAAAVITNLGGYRP